MQGMRGKAMTINQGGSCSCDICGSNTMGYLCSCGRMRCSCEQEPCQNCEMQFQQREEQARYEFEQEEREDFENRMYKKYHER